MKLRITLLAVAAAVVWPAAGNAATMRGVVVAKSHGMLLVATSSGAVRAERGTAAVGARIAGGRVVGHASRARIHGVVVRHVGATTFLSSNRHLLAVHDTTPAPNGTVVTTTVGVQPSGELDEQQEDDNGQVAGNTLPIQATITAVGAGTVTVSVNGQSLTVSLPNGLTLPASLVGQTVTFDISLNDNNGQDQGDDSSSSSGSGSGGSGDGGGDD